jgi:hypothetical protein
MIKYDIYQLMIYYTTGDSFGSYEHQEIFDFEWYSLELTKQNIQNIIEHYKQYKEIDNHYDKEELILNLNKNKEWFVENDDIKMQSRNCLYIILDNKNKVQIMPEWTGYSSFLNLIEIYKNSRSIEIINI